MRALANKDGDLKSHFDKIDESEALVNFTLLKHLPVNHHDIAANKEEIKGQLPLQRVFGFCKTYKKITKQLEFHLSFKTAELKLHTMS